MLLPALRIFLLALCFPSLLYAQKEASGVVGDYRTKERLQGAFIRNSRSGDTVISDQKGKFSIPVKLNDMLVFSAPGYKTDSALVIDFYDRKVELSPLGIQLDEVKVSRSPIFDPKKEYPDVYRKSQYLHMNGGLIFTLSSLLSKEGKEARQLKRFFKKEVIDREVRRLFTRELVTSIVPLKGQQLDNFMMMYRPSLGFLKKASKSDMTLYLNDCYKKFMLLPEKERNHSPLKIDQLQDKDR